MSFRVQKNTLSKNNKLKMCATSENVARRYSAASTHLVLCPSEQHTYNVDMGDVCVNNVKKFSESGVGHFCRSEVKYHMITYVCFESNID